MLKLGTIPGGEASLAYRQTLHCLVQRFVDTHEAAGHCEVPREELPWNYVAKMESQPLLMIINQNRRCCAASRATCNCGLTGSLRCRQYMASARAR